MNCMAYELSLIFVLIINWKWIACEYCRLFTVLSSLFFLVILSVFCYLRLMFSPQEVQNRMLRLQNCVQYPVYLSPLSTETLCPISYFTLFWLQFITRPLCPHRFWVSQFFCSCSYHLEFPSLGYSQQFYHTGVLFSPPTQNLLLQSSFSATIVPLPTPAQRLRFGRSIADIVRFTNSFTYLLTYLLKSINTVSSINNLKYVSVSWYFFLHGINIMIQFKSIIHNTEYHVAFRELL